MRGKTHAATAAVAWTVLATPKVYLDSVIPDLPHITLTAGLIPTTLPVYLMGLVMVHGAGMVPDADHHNGTIAHSVPSVGPFPSPTKAVCQFIGKISGGHRHATHSFLGIAIAALLAWLSTFIKVPVMGHELAIGTGVWAFFLTAFALKVLKIESNNWLLMWLTSLLMAVAAIWFFGDTLNTTLPLIVALGCFIHCVGDSLTVGGVPWLYPFHPKPPKVVEDSILGKFWYSNGYFAFPVLGKVNSDRDRGVDREDVVFWLSNAYIVVGVAVGLFGVFTHHSIELMPLVT